MWNISEHIGLHAINLLAGGCLSRISKASLREKKNDINKIKTKSMYRNSMSDKVLFSENNNKTLINWVKLYMHTNLTTPKDVIKVALPSLIRIGTHSIFWFFDVKGLAIEASAVDNEMPEFAVFRAPN